MRLLLLLVLSRVGASAPQQLNFTYRDVGFDGGGWVTGLETHTSTGLVYARTDVGGAYRSDDGGRSWQWLSGFFETPDYSWETQGIAVNQSDPSGCTVLFSLGAGAVSPSSGVYKSKDCGKTWVRTLAGVAANSNCYTRHGSPSLLVDAARPSRVWAAMQQGLWRSEDGGESWEPVPAFNSAPFYNGSAFSEHGGYTMSLVSIVPPDPHTGIVDPLLAGHVVVGAAIMGLAFSSDDGASWRQLSTEDGTLPVNISAPWRFFRTPNGSAFVAVTYGGGARGHGGTDGGLWRVDAPTVSAWSDPLQWKWTDVTPVSADWGYWGFWGLVDMPLGFDGGLLVASPSAPSMFTSTDGGASWQLRNATMAYDLPCWQPAEGQPQTITYGRNNIVVTSRNPGTWLMSTGFGVASSTDLGDNWGSASRGIGETVTFRCHSHPSRANWTFCGVGDLTGFVITDGGVSGVGIAAFHEQPHYWTSDFGHGAAWMGANGLAFPGGTQLNGCLGQWITWPEPGAAPLAVTAGVNTSGVLHGIPLQFVGVTQASDNPLDLLLLASSSDYSGRFYPWNHSEMSSYTGGVVRSLDGGATWNHVTVQPASGWVGTVWDDFPQLSIDGGDADVRWWALAESGLYISRDRGETWAVTSTQLCADAASFHASVVPDFRRGAGATFILAGCVGGASSLMRTSNYGDSFTPVGNFTAPSRPHGAPTAHIWVTIDVTAEPPAWTAARVDVVERQGHYLGGTGVSGLEWDAVDPNVLYISTNGHGVIVVALAS